MRKYAVFSAALLALTMSLPIFAADKPNILVIWGDDIGLWNISANSRGMMGYKTPNIDRIANEGMQKKDPTIASLLKDQGYATGQFGKNHLDGYNILPLLTGASDESPRKEIFYFTDDGDLSALRYQDWKLIFMEQRSKGTLQLWANPFTELRIPLIFNLRRDPFERAMETSNTYYDWLLDRVFLLVPAQTYVGQFLSTFKEYPPRQKAASFSLSDVMEKLSDGSGSH